MNPISRRHARTRKGYKKHKHGLTPFEVLQVFPLRLARKPLAGRGSPTMFANIT